MLQPSIYHAEVPPGPLRRRARLALDELEGDAASVRRFLEGFSLDLEDAASAITFSESERVRKLVARGDAIDLYLCTWLPGQVTPIEEDAPAPGGLRVLTGTLTEDVYAKTRDGEAAHKLDSRVLETGAVSVRETPIIHRYRNASSALAVSLHLAPRSHARPRRFPPARSPSAPTG